LGIVKWARLKDRDSISNKVWSFKHQNYSIKFTQKNSFIVANFNIKVAADMCAMLQYTARWQFAKKLYF
jgi:hypothetical protein